MIRALLAWLSPTEVVEVSGATLVMVLRQAGYQGNFYRRLAVFGAKK